MVFEQTKKDSQNQTKTDPQKKPSSKSEARNLAIDSIFSEQPAIESIASKRNGYTSVSLSKLVPDEANTRIGQSELIEKLPSIVLALQKEVVWPADLPKYKEMKNKIDLSPEAIILLDSCIELANTFIDGHANEAITVFPSDKMNGDHIIFTGYRRFIAYNLLNPFTGVTSLDVIVDRTIADPKSPAAHIRRITENNVKKANTLGEMLRSLNIVVDSLKADGEPVNVTHIAKLTGIERTTCGRLLKIVEANLPEPIFTWIHNNGIHDITSLAMIFEQPSDQWGSLLNQLKEEGPTVFRSSIRAMPDQDTASSNPPVKEKRNPGTTDGGSTAFGATQLLNFIKENKPEWFNAEIDNPVKQLSNLLKKLSKEQ